MLASTMLPPKRARTAPLKQWLIGLGQRYGRIAHPGTGGDPRMLHTYVVLQTFPSLGRIRVADAARDRDGREGVGSSYYDFRAPTHHSPGGTHLFYRFNDRRLANAVRIRAEAWASRPIKNFSDLRAAMAPFRSWAIFCGARRHIRHLVAHAPMAGPVPKIYGRGPYPLMCSNFVSSVCVPEIVALHCRDHRLPLAVTSSTLMALQVGCAGNIFDSDPRWMLPSTLQARFAASPAISSVGTIRSENAPRRSKPS